jgi:predicted nucleic acid-binding protein
LTVYVESNFVLELALGQEQAAAANAILEYAERADITLALPAFAISEPFSTVTQRSRDLKKLGTDLSKRLEQLARSTPHRTDVRSLESVPTTLAGIEAREIDDLTSTIGRILKVAIVIPVDARVFEMGVAYRGQLGLSPQDSLIYAAVINHLSTTDYGEPHFFINRNWKDFDVPDIRAELGALGCELLRSFPEGALRMEKPLPE